MKDDHQERRDGGDRVDEHGISLARMMSFSDGVFAVAITLLVLSIKVPAVSPEVADLKLPRELLHLWPIFWAYIVSFMVIGLFWIGHHRVFKLFRRHDSGLLWLNLVFLMLVVFIPFPTSLMSEYPRARVSLIFYAASLAVAGFMICFLMWYGIHDRRLVDEDMDPIAYRRFMFGYISMAVVFLLSIPISYLNLHVARYSWVVIVPVNLFFDHFVVYRLERGRGRERGAT